MEMERYEDGVPSWVDLGSPDLAAAKAFYSGLFGWDTPDGPPEAGGYCVCLLNGRTVAGLGPKMNPEGPTVWTTYVNVRDADEVARKVTANGGQVFMAPFDVLEAGRMGIFADPAGAVFGVWQPNGHLGAGVVNEPGSLVWNELVTTDVAGAMAFYGAVFGWGAQAQGPLGADGVGAYTEWKVSDRSVGGLMAKPETMPAEVPPHWMTYFAVADTDKAVAKVEELGGTVMMGATDIEPGRFAVVADPTGGFFGVITMKEGPAT